MIEFNSKRWLNDLKTKKNVALRQLYRAYRQPFLIWAKKQSNLSEPDLADTFQEAVIVFYQQVLNGRITQLDATIKTYLFGIGKKILLKKGVKTSRYQLIATPEEQLIQEMDWSVFEREEANHRQRLIQDSLEKLGEPCQKILRLFYFERYRAKEISITLGYSSEEVVRSQKLRCINQLRKWLSKDMF